MVNNPILLLVACAWTYVSLNASTCQPHISPDTINLAFDYEPFSVYRVIDDKDGSKIEVGHKADMGVVYMQYYSLRPDNEDGEYVIYVNDTLRSRCFVKNNLRIGSWLKYDDSGQVESEMPYENGFRYGVSKWYNQKRLEIITIWAIDTGYLDIYLYPSGKVKQRYFACGQPQQFGEDGQVISLPIGANKTLGSWDCPLVDGEEPLKNGVLHGDCFYQYGGLKYDMKFQEGTLQKLTLIKQGKVILDELPIGY